MQVTASAPGKLVLYGDHAVVHGQPGIVTAVDHRYRVTATRLGEPLLRIKTATAPERTVRLGEGGWTFSAQTAFVEAAVKHLQQELSLDGGFRIVTDGPAQSYGLGSSSAVTVATLAATAALCDAALSRDWLYRMARAAVLEVQGTGSGLDVAASTYGGTLYLERAGAVPASVATDALPLVIAYSGTKVGTTGLIKRVASLRARQPDLVEALFAIAGRIAIRARSCLEDGRWQDLGTMTNLYQGLLEALGVGTADQARLIYAARSAGAWGAKLSGAGGGDCMFALAAGSARARVAAQITAAGGEVLQLATGAPGVRLHDEA